MPDTREVVSIEETSNRKVTRAGWGVLLIWAGIALLLNLGWGVGLVGAGAIVLALQAIRGYLGLRWDWFGVVAGLILVICGVWNVFDVSVHLVPVLCIVAGVALLVSTWATKRAHHPPGGQADLPSGSHPGA